MLYYSNKNLEKLKRKVFSTKNKKFVGILLIFMYFLISGISTNISSSGMNMPNLTPRYMALPTNIANDSGFTVGAFNASSAWHGNVSINGPQGNLTYAPTRDYVFYNNYNASYKAVVLQIQDNTPINYTFPDAGKLAWINQTLPLDYFAAPTNLTVSVFVQYDLRISANQTIGMNTTTQVIAQVTLANQVQDLEHYNSTNSNVATYDTGWKSQMTNFNLTTAAYQNYYRTNFPLSVRLLVPSIGLGRTADLLINNTQALVVEVAAMNYATDTPPANPPNTGSIVNDGNFTQDFWDPTFGWQAGLNGSVYVNRTQDYALYKGEQESASAPAANYTTLYLTDVNTPADLNKMVDINQTLPLYYFANV